MGFAWVVARLPVRWSNGLGRGVGFLLSRLSPRRRQIALDNIAKALPDHSAPELSEAMYRHYGLMIVEMLRTAGGRPPPMTFDGIEHLDRALEGRRGAIILGGHVGNFELLVHTAARRPMPVNVLIRPFSSPVADAVLRRLRGKGPNLIASSRAGREALRVLREGELLVFVLDQHTATRRAAWVPFFGRPAATSLDAVRLAHRSGAPIIPAFTWRRAEDHLAEFWAAVELGEPTDEGIEKDTAKCVALVEAAIRREPAQWSWTHRRWKSPPRMTPTQDRESNG